MDKIDKSFLEKITRMPEEEKVNKDEKYWAEYNGDDRLISSDEVLEMIKNNPQPKGISTGFEKLDKALELLHPGEVVVISGHTGSGKTLLAQSMTQKMLDMDSSISTMWISYEVRMSDLAIRFSKMCGNDKIVLYYTPAKNEARSVVWIEEKILESRAKKYNPQIVFIDHLDYIVPFIPQTNKAEVIGEVMRKLKTMAIKYSLVIVLMCHMKKTEKMTSDIDLSLLRGSSFIGQEADIVLLIRRLRDMDEIIDCMSDRDSDLIIDKNRRTGIVGKIFLTYTCGQLVEKI